jgi:hypothetical protein
MTAQQPVALVTGAALAQASGRHRGVERLGSGRRQRVAPPGGRPVTRPCSRAQWFGVWLHRREWPRRPPRRNATLALLQ